MTKARIKLDKGTLRTAALGVYRRKTVTAQFVPPPKERPGRKQALPRQVALEVLAIPDDVEVQVRAKRFAGEPKERVLRLRPIPDVKRPGKKLVEVEVRNLCCESIIADKDVEDFPEADLDFEYFYLVAKNYETLKKDYVRFPVPVPVEFNNDSHSGQSGGDTIKCSVARFSAPPAAREPSSYSEDDKEAD
jgi:hypothetical protein